MKADKPSFTAAAVAVCRTANRLLPEDARLIDDPYGIEFGPPALRAVMGTSLRFANVLEPGVPLIGPLHRLLLWMQLRTRQLDETLLEFVRSGGKQVLLLGAGFDVRAIRFAKDLEDVTFFEVDHRATQTQKRKVLDRLGASSARTIYIEWDFEERPLSQLPASLVNAGHDPNARTLTIWEGVTMYLTEQALNATVRAIHALSAEGSPFALTYITPKLMRRMKVGLPFVHQNEPFRFAWEKGAIGDWLKGRGFELQADYGAAELARTYLPARYAASVDDGRRIAIAMRSGSKSEH